MKLIKETLDCPNCSIQVNFDEYNKNEEYIIKLNDTFWVQMIA